MLCQEAVVTEKFSLFVVVLGVDQGAVALGADEALVVPVALSVEHQVLDMDGQVTTFADLRYRLSLKIITPVGEMMD